MSRVFIYVVDRDFGFAPNPFHGFCTLATCKPGIRKSAEVGDWVFGIGGARLRSTGKCVYAMLITKKITFNEYWTEPTYLVKRPVRNGSRRMSVGDNIYCKVRGSWTQANSHHSNSDGSINLRNVRTDTKSEFVLISENFVYFGRSAPQVPKAILEGVGYANGRNYRVFEAVDSQALIDWVLQAGVPLNEVKGDPFDFYSSEKRYTGVGSKLS